MMFHKQHQVVGLSLSPRRAVLSVSACRRGDLHRAGRTAKEIQVLQALDSLGSGQTKERQPSLSLPSEPSVQFGPAQVSSGKRKGQAEGEGEQAR